MIYRHDSQPLGHSSDFWTARLWLWFTVHLLKILMTGPKAYPGLSSPLMVAQTLDVYIYSKAP